MKTYYMLTYAGKPITHIAIDNEEVRIVTDEDCKPIFLIGKDCAIKMCVALTWLMNDWDFGWEKIYV